MAVDTAQKRLSAVGVGLPYRGYPIVPAGSSTVDTRRVGLFLYSGEPEVAVIAALEIRPVGMTPTSTPKILSLKP